MSLTVHRVIEDSSSTGTSETATFEASRFVGIQVASTGGATLALQGSLDGVHWQDLIASSTYADGTIKVSTGGLLVTHARAVVSVNGSTNLFVYLTAD
jgi:hypothetical protein